VAHSFRLVPQPGVPVAGQAVLAGPLASPLTSTVREISK
jgi:hypothetical protein